MSVTLDLWSSRFRLTDKRGTIVADNVYMMDSVWYRTVIETHVLYKSEDRGTTWEVKLPDAVLRSVTSITWHGDESDMPVICGTCPVILAEESE